MRIRVSKSRLGLIALSASAVLLATMPGAIADQFTPQAGPPTVQLLSAPSSYTPDQAGSSNSDYTISVGVTSEAGADNIVSVRVCLYDEDNLDFNQTFVDFNCGNDPRYGMGMYWNSGGFGFEWGAYYSNAASQAVTNGNSGTWDFNFHISEAMKQGNNWNFIVQACDFNVNCGTYSSFDAGRTPASVSWFGWTYQPSSPIDFGSVAKDGNSGLLDNFLGNGMANGDAAVSYQTSQYEYNGGAAVLPLDGGAVGDAPGLGKVAVDCDTELGLGSNFRLKTTPQIASTGFFTLGAAEGGESMGMYGCTLYYGGGAAVAGVPYYSTFYVGISETP